MRATLLLVGGPVLNPCVEMIRHEARSSGPAVKIIANKPPARSKAEREEE
jgi:hypothetical protein